MLTCSAAFGSFLRIARPASLSLTAMAAAKGVFPLLSLSVRSMSAWDSKMSEQRGCLQQMETCRAPRPVESCEGVGGCECEGVRVCV